MKNSIRNRIKYIFLKGFIMFLLCIFRQTTYGQTNNDTNNSLIKEQDSLNISTIGIFDGIIINKYGYKINEYYIAITDLISIQVDSLKGKRVLISGKLNIADENDDYNIQSVSEIKRYITEPKFTIVYYCYCVNF